MELSQNDFDFLREFVRARSAIELGENKQYLVEARLQPIIHREGLDNYSDLVNQLKQAAQGPLHEKVVDAMTTNETSFFRDMPVFDALAREIIPEVMKQNQATRTINIWSAACSSGQEIYSTCIILLERFPQLRLGWRLNLMATDLSTEILERAEAGRYSQLEINRGMPAKYLVRYFEQDGSKWTIKPEIRDMVSFKQLNLIKPWPMLPKMDIVFMRNVLYYFSTETRKQILSKVKNQLGNEGYLLLGAAETIQTIDDRFKREHTHKATYYKLR